MISSTSFSSDLSKLSQDAQLTSSVTVGTKKKTKKKIGFLTLNKPTSSSHSGSSKAPKLNSTDVKSKQQLPSLKSSTMPRPPKPPPTTKLVPPPSAGGATPPTSKKVLSFSLSKRNSPLSGKTEQVKPVKNSTNLSFSELKKQHQILLREVEDLKTQVSDNEMRHKKELQLVREKLEDSELSVTLLKQELENKESQLKDKNYHIQELKSQLDRVSFDKERLLMVIESAQRDALTGEPIFHDTSLWQQPRDEIKAKTLRYSTLLDEMIRSLQTTSTQLQEQQEGIKGSQQIFT